MAGVPNSTTVHRFIPRDSSVPLDSHCRAVLVPNYVDVQFFRQMQSATAGGICDWCMFGAWSFGSVVVRLMIKNTAVAVEYGSMTLTITFWTFLWPR